MVKASYFCIVPAFLSLAKYKLFDGRRRIEGTDIGDDIEDVCSVSEITMPPTKR